MLNDSLYLNGFENSHFVKASFSIGSLAARKHGISSLRPNNKDNLLSYESCGGKIRDVVFVLKMNAFTFLRSLSTHPATSCNIWWKRFDKFRTSEPENFIRLGQDIRTLMKSFNHNKD
jgi:hypothetical protein